MAAGAISLRSPQWGDVACGVNRLRRAELCPIGHEFAPFVEQVAAPIGGLHLIPDHMRERHLDDVIWIAGSFGCPISEC